MYFRRLISVYFPEFTKFLTLKMAFGAIMAMAVMTACSSEFSSEGNLGIQDNSIIGGQAATATDAITRSTVALVSAKNDILKEQCTGTLISSNLVLTAAHCLEGLRPNNVWIHFGANLPRPFYLNQLTQVKDFIVHPKFGPVYDSEFPATELNDIAVILLKENAPAGYSAVPVKEGKSSEVGDTLLLAGYGHISDVNPIRATNLNFARVVVHQIWQSLLVLDQSNKSGACKGDSGGPAYIETDNGLVVVGITRGAHDKSPHCHGLVEYTNATFFKTFILESARDLNAELPQFTE